jgi:hypothetical protein
MAKFGKFNKNDNHKLMCRSVPGRDETECGALGSG